jgi:hypothetical protein
MNYIIMFKDNKVWSSCFNNESFVFYDGNVSFAEITNYRNR